MPTNCQTLLTNSAVTCLAHARGCTALLFQVVWRPPCQLHGDITVSRKPKLTRPCMHTAHGCASPWIGLLVLSPGCSAAQGWLAVSHLRNTRSFWSASAREFSTMRMTCRCVVLKLSVPVPLVDNGKEHGVTDRLRQQHACWMKALKLPFIMCCQHGVMLAWNQSPGTP